ncbi:lytic transglycosylase domain-containing protein [Altererythrobacter soli]|uniref:Lytic transglycosylase domain-containing protein n=1 Tax=Croceibacterium soli TaxID=1739690 RepID=A0A6I4USD3_9SPHN|nr:lytic transglycosylase domain-containing protein [Croceibacterium soli]MXP41548.1 lytic transglycosylase domain-containing protein [Croceibacterium soli]
MHSAIARASAATGVDFNYLLAQAKLESGLDTNARAGTSSAAGLYQFIGGTWLETLDRHGSTHGLGWADSLISRRGGRADIADPAVKAEVLALRFDPNVSALMAAELARDNAAELSGFLGREPDSAELYLAHFLGSGGAKTFLGALQDSPHASAAGLFPKQAAANRPIFYDGARPRAVGEVMDLLRSKVAAAMEGGAALPPSAGGYAYSPAQATFTHAAASFAEAPAPARRPSMAETLQATFGGAAMDGRAAQRIGDAYGKFKAFGL